MYYIIGEKKAELHPSVIAFTHESKDYGILSSDFHINAPEDYGLRVIYYSGQKPMFDEYSGLSESEQAFFDKVLALIGG